MNAVPVLGCEQCRFFLALKTIDVSPNAAQGECRRNPPTRSTVMTAHGIATMCGWPTVRRENSCGEFRARVTL